MRFLHRRTMTLPTWRGWLLILVIGTAAVIGAGRAVHPFLAVTKSVQAEVLVIEGWLADYAIESGADTFRRDSSRYQRVYVTGGPLEKASHMAGFESYATSGAAVLIAAGLASDVVVPVPSDERYRNRTYAAALALRDYCASNGIELGSVNVVTLGTHARRSRLSFRRALGRDVRVGVIAVPSRDYEDARWWRYSEGVKAVVSELVALPYAWVGQDYGK
jgi:uncharacterized SAM-binding protein YcdF (DUF218 family)